jgi:hypothetical protein
MFVCEIPATLQVLSLGAQSRLQNLLAAESDCCTIWYAIDSTDRWLSNGVTIVAIRHFSTVPQLSEDLFQQKKKSIFSSVRRTVRFRRLTYDFISTGDA